MFNITSISLSYFCLLADRLHSLYPDLLKRLDDSSDEIRIATTRTLVAFVRSVDDK